MPRYRSGQMRILRWLPSVVLLLPWLLGPLAPSTEERVRDLSGPSAFRLLDWETVNVGERAGRLLTGLSGPDQVDASDGDTLKAYFNSGSLNTALRSSAEAALERVVAGAYRDAGVTRSQPLPIQQLFPPVLVALTPPPNVLVVAPRTELRVLDSTIMQAMDVPAQERLEASVDSNDVSSLVAPIGGLATYPSMVLEGDTAQPVLAAVAHEWMHQYLIFYPLGAGYWSSQETREINETTAEMIGQEVGTELADALGLSPAPAPPSAPASDAPPRFDFRAFMRETRQQTETMLQAGQVSQAEAYMNSRRDELQRHGYQIRKLNQAYFALYGSYGEGYAASPSNPIPDLLHALRQRSSTLGEFIFQIREITTVAELRQAAASG
jgi:hypothetical protein